VVGEYEKRFGPLNIEAATTGGAGAGGGAKK
jgi:hypothetical protein